MFDASSTTHPPGNEERGGAWLKPQATLAGQAPFSRHKLKTFIVEDSPVIRETLIATLEELGPVEVVGSAEDETGAVRWLAAPEHTADLVIVDIFLKSGSGLGVLRGANRAGLTRKFVVLSNYATPDIRRKCLELGAQRVFDKSIDIDELISYCERLAGGEAGGSGPAGLS